MDRRLYIRVKGTDGKRQWVSLGWWSGDTIYLDSHKLRKARNPDREYKSNRRIYKLERENWYDKDGKLEETIKPSST